MDGRARVVLQASKRAKHGFVDRSGHVIIAPAYDDVTDFRRSTAVVDEHDRNWLIDREGRIVTPKYNRMFDYFDELIEVDAVTGNGVVNMERSSSNRAS